MLLAPGLVLALLLTRQHLIEGLTFGIMAATVIALSLGLIAPNQLMDIDTDNFIAKGIILDGMERGIGVSFFTILLMGLVGGIEATGLVNRLVESARDRIHTVRQAEVWIFTTVSAVVLLLSHSTVAILTVGRFVKDTGEGFGTSRYRRANILDITVSTYPFLLPFFVPTFLTASTTAAGEAFGLPRISPLEVGLYNLHSWALLLVVVVAIVTGWGREMEEKPKRVTSAPPRDARLAPSRPPWRVGRRLRKRRVADRTPWHARQERTVPTLAPDGLRKDGRCLITLKAPCPKRSPARTRDPAILEGRR